MMMNVLMADTPSFLCQSANLLFFLPIEPTVVRKEVRSKNNDLVS